VHRRPAEHERRLSVGDSEVDESGKLVLGCSGRIAVGELLLKLDPVPGTQIDVGPPSEPFSRSIIAITEWSRAIDEGCDSLGKLALTDASPALSPASKPSRLRNLPGNCGVSARMLLSER
jgi:hypothetical protein